MSPEMKIKLRSLLIKHEGIKHHLYKDTKDKWTIGIGHNLDDLGLSTKIIYDVFDEDMDSHESFLSKFEWFHQLDENRQCALLDLSYNVGDKNFEKFENFIEAIKVKDFEKASEEILNSLYHKEVGQRANDLAEIIRTGIL